MRGMRSQYFALLRRRAEQCIERYDTWEVNTKEHIESGSRQDASEALLLLQTTCVNGENEQVEDSNEVMVDKFHCVADDGCH